MSVRSYVFKLLKKFFQNEWIGIKQIRLTVLSSINVTNAKRYSQRGIFFTRDKVMEKNYPDASKLMKEISEESGVNHRGVFLRGTAYDNNAAAYLHTKKIEIGRGNLKDIKAFISSYAHELGHIKHTKLHHHLNLGCLDKPYNLLLYATTSMYGLGLSAYTFMGDNKVLDGANWLFGHTGKYLAAAAVTNAILVRTREHTADLFAYKHTGLLPSVRVENERNGVLGNISKTINGVLDKVQSGYPTKFERDIVCKILGGKPKKLSFVEQLNVQKNSPQENKWEMVEKYKETSSAIDMFEGYRPKLDFTELLRLSEKLKKDKSPSER